MKNNSPLFVEVCEGCDEYWPVNSCEAVYEEHDTAPIKLCPDCINTIKARERKLAIKTKPPTKKVKKWTKLELGLD